MDWKWKCLSNGLSYTFMVGILYCPPLISLAVGDFRSFFDPLCGFPETGFPSDIVRSLLLAPICLTLRLFSIDGDTNPLLSPTVGTPNRLANLNSFCLVGLFSLVMRKSSRCLIFSLGMEAVLCLSSSSSESNDLDLLAFCSNVPFCTGSGDI